MCPELCRILSRQSCGEQQKQKNLSELIYVENCYATAQGRTLFLTERLTQTGLLHLVAVIAIGKGSAFSLLKVSARNDMYNCFWASSFCVRDIFLQTLHYAFIDTHDKISFEIFDIGLFGECKKIFFAGEGSIICFVFFVLVCFFFDEFKYINTFQKKKKSKTIGF